MKSYISLNIVCYNISYEHKQEKAHTVRLISKHLGIEWFLPILKVNMKKCENGLLSMITESWKSMDVLMLQD